MRYCIKGNIHTPIIGKVYDIKGEMDYSPTWGEQISILESSMNNDLAETDIRGQKYILCKLFPKHVQRMYETLDNPYLALKEGNVKELTKIKGCGPNVATNIDGEHIFIKEDNDRHCIVEHLGWYRTYYFYNRWYVLGLEDYTWNCYTDEEFKEEFELVEGR